MMARSPKVLVVDDEPAILLTIQALLESSGFRVVTSNSGREALAIFEREPFDVVLMDYAMPGMTGVATAAHMKEMRSEVPIAFLSAYRELPGETVGLAEWWVRKGEEDPETLVRRIAALANRGGSDA